MTKNRICQKKFASEEKFDNVRDRKMSGRNIYSMSWSIGSEIFFIPFYFHPHLGVSFAIKEEEKNIICLKNI